MNDLPSYSDYKESGVEWLGKIPNHWKISRLKFLGDIVLGLTYSSEDITTENGILVFRSSNVQNGQLTFDDNVYVDKDIPKKMITTEYDILICSRNGSRDLIGKSALISEEGIGQTFGAFMTIFRTPYRKYIYYILNSELFKYQIGSFLTSTINQLTTYVLGNFKICFPSLEEQKAITRYLDKKLAQIDTLITKQQALLEKLAEQRIALISNAVTKGLNPDVEMKESGVEWLGKIPLDWTIKRLKFLLVGKLKYGANESAESEDLGQPRYIRITDIDEKGNLRDETFKSLEIEKAQEYLLKDLDILLARSGATVGKSYLYHKNSVGSACYAGYLIRARLNFHKFDAEFVNYFLQSKNYWDWINSINIQSTIQNVSAEKYSDLVLAIPPLLLQKQIVQILKAEDLEFEITTNKGNELITLLKEYRSTLITQAVTGKIDVRNLAN